MRWPWKKIGVSRIPRRFDMRDKGWGNSLEIMGKKQEDGSWSACMFSSPLPQNGDEVILEVMGRRDMVFKITNVRPCGNPYDQCFCNITDIDYLENCEATC
jgi:hypothetical protein